MRRVRRGWRVSERRVGGLNLTLLCLIWLVRWFVTQGACIRWMDSFSLSLCGSRDGF